jgi:hypothetical protein
MVFRRETAGHCIPGGPSLGLDANRTRKCASSRREGTRRCMQATASPLWAAYRSMAMDRRAPSSQTNGSDRCGGTATEN